MTETGPRDGRYRLRRRVVHRRAAPPRLRRPHDGPQPREGRRRARRGCGDRDRSRNHGSPALVADLTADDGLGRARSPAAGPCSTSRSPLGAEDARGRRRAHRRRARDGGAPGPARRVPRAGVRPRRDDLGGEHRRPVLLRRRRRPRRDAAVDRSRRTGEYPRAVPPRSKTLAETRPRGSFYAERSGAAETAQH